MPPKPFLLYGAGTVPALSASMRTLPPLAAGTPKDSAAGPDRKVTMPSLKVSCASAGVQAKAAIVVSATLVSLTVNVAMVAQRNCVESLKGKLIDLSPVFNK